MSKLSEFHSKNNFEYISFLINLLLERIDGYESNTITNESVDAYKWKVMAEECDNEEMKEKYMSVSHTLFDMFMAEHDNIGKIFKEEKKEIV